MARGNLDMLRSVRTIYGKDVSPEKTTFGKTGPRWSGNMKMKSGSASCFAPA